MRAIASKEEVLLAKAPFHGLLTLPVGADRPCGTIVLAHGFACSPRAYSQLADLWAQDGWAVYAPQLYTVCTPVNVEVEPLARACSWAFAKLPRPLVLAGHSRGAQAALTLLLRITAAEADASPTAVGTPARPVRGAPMLAAFRGLVLLDPVEGRPGPLGYGLRHVLLTTAGLDWRWTDLPVLLVSAGCSSAGAPPEHDAAALYSALRAATHIGIDNYEFGEAPFHLVDAQRFGHMDFLDDSIMAAGFVPALATLLLPGNRHKRAELRAFARDAFRVVFGAGDKRSVARRLTHLEERNAPE